MHIKDIIVTYLTMFVSISEIEPPQYTLNCLFAKCALPIQ